MVYYNYFLFMMVTLWLLPTLQQMQGELLATKNKTCQCHQDMVAWWYERRLLQHF